MRVEHDGMAIPLHSHSCVMSLSIWRFSFLLKVDDPPWKKKFLKSSWVWEEGR
jgi:hypothetical protein